MPYVGVWESQVLVSCGKDRPVVLVVVVDGKGGDFKTKSVELWGSKWVFKLRGVCDNAKQLQYDIERTSLMVQHA